MTNNKSANWIMTTMAILAICIGPTACEPNNNSEEIADTNKVSENVKSNDSADVKNNSVSMAPGMYENGDVNWVEVQFPDGSYYIKTYTL